MLFDFHQILHDDKRWFVTSFHATQKYARVTAYDLLKYMHTVYLKMQLRVWTTFRLGPIAEWLVVAEGQISFKQLQDAQLL